MDIYNKIIQLYQNNEYEEIRNIYNTLDKNEEKGIFFVIELILLFHNRNIMEYSEKLSEFYDYLKKKPSPVLLSYYHIRKHLLHIYLEEYSEALEELSLAAQLVRENDNFVKLKWICFQELEISTFYLKNFSLSRRFIEKYFDAMQDSDETRAYIDTVLAYIYSHESDPKAVEYAEKAYITVSGIKRSKEIVEDIYIRLAFVFLNLRKFEVIPQILKNINKTNPDRFLIESYYYYNTGNLEASYNIFSEAYHMFYPKKRVDEYWLRFFMLAADISEKQGNIERAEGYYFFMLEQFDFIWNRLNTRENRDIFIDFYKLYLTGALYFFRKHGKTEKFEQLFEKYSEDFSHIFEMTDQIM